MKLFRIAALAAAALVVLAPAGRTEEQQWGTIKGKIILDGAIPARAKIIPTNDRAFCEKNGPVLSEELIVDPKTKGVRWALVWLTDEKGTGKLPIHPKLAVAPKKVEIDQPCCSYEPRVLGLRTGQILVAKNSASVPHNIKINGAPLNPDLNILVPAGKSLEVDGWKAPSTTTPPVPVGCSIHGFMGAFIGVFDHPYFAVTNEKGEFEIKDAPAGKYRMIVWQESVGWVVKEGKNSGKKGIPVDIKPGVTASAL